MWAEAFSVAVAGFIVVAITLVVLTGCIKLMSAACKVVDKKFKTGR